MGQGALGAASSLASVPPPPTRRLRRTTIAPPLLAIAPARAASLTLHALARPQEDVADFLGDEGKANEVIQEWQERYQKYKLMEAHLNRRREEIKKKIP